METGKFADTLNKKNSQNSIAFDNKKVYFAKEVQEKLSKIAFGRPVPVPAKLIAALLILYYRYQDDDECECEVVLCRTGDFNLKETCSTFRQILKADTTPRTIINSLVKNINFISYLNTDHSISCAVFAPDDMSNALAVKCITKSDGTDLFLAKNGNKVQQFATEEHFIELVKSLIQGTDVGISSLRMLSDSEITQLRKWSISYVSKELSVPTCLNDLFMKTVQLNANRIAVQCKGKETSYHELNELSNKLACYLRNEGIGPGNRVAFILPRSEEIFIVLLAILKSGAAYVPIDPRSPSERIHFILEDADVKLVITDSQLKEQNNIIRKCFLIEDRVERCKDLDSSNIKQSDTGLKPSDPAYIIYTSGTTGKPKGVVILHQTVCNLVRSESFLFNVNKYDRVFQGFSISFDASVEELWLAWFCGAALVVATKAEALSGPDLTQFLDEEKVTVFSTVPTQISMMNKAVESVRILILGGEECHQKAIEPWLNDKRKVYNTYGPTEATVIATYGSCSKDKKPDIGKPVPNYAVFILDRNMQPVPIGMTGELYIGGHSLAAGYLNLPDLTAQKFVKPSFIVGNAFPDRLYKSGDRASFLPDGNIEFGGRFDDQIKLRGQRIELGEIEAAIVKSVNVRQVAVAVVKNTLGIQSLVAYVAPGQDVVLNAKEIRKKLSGILPSYMIPAQFGFFDQLPILSSGKIDRKRLSTLEIAKDPVQRKITGPQTETEKTIHRIWEKHFERNDISTDDDFFDLGGHSLLAATIISELRNESGMKNLPFQFIYKNRTIQSFAAACEKEDENSKISTVNEKVIPQVNSSEIGRKYSLFRSIICTLFQSAALYPIYLLFSIPLLIPFTIDWFNPEIEAFQWMTASIISLLLLLPFTIAASIAIKWILIGKYKEGVYPLWGGYYLRFWFVSRVLDLVPVRMMRGTPFLTIYYRLLGAKIGKNTFIGTDCFRVCDMVSIGDNSSVNADAHLMAYSISNGNLIIGKIDIGKNCVIGTRSVIGENTKIEDGAELGELSLLPSGSTIPKGEYWDGSPAEHNKNKAISPSQKYNALVSGTFKYYVLFSFAFIFSLFLPIMLLLPCIIAAFELYVNLGPFYTVLFTVPLSALYTILFCFSVALVKKILFSSSQKSKFSIYSTEYIKKWIVDSLVQLSLMTIQPVYATIYLPMWLRMLGAKVGKRAEISTVDHITAESLSLGEESFIADSASVGPSVVKHGFLFTGKTIIGRRTFIGNSALIPISCSIGENCLIGVLSKPPVECSEKIINDTNWLGSPPIVLPKRQDSKAFDSTQTYNPPFKMVLLRGCIEFLKITVPQALMSSCFITAYWFMSEVLGPVASLFSYICFCPVVILGCTLTVTWMTIILKWLIVGRYRKVEQPLWSLFIWKNELINSLCENLVYPLLLQMIQGTLLLPMFFRLLGSKIGKNVYMETTEITEFDLVKIEDNASLNTGSTIQTHLFEDRVMKMSSLHIGKNVTIGPMSVVLYDSSMKEGAYLDGLSLLMKGEILPAETFWYGIPARSKKNSHQLKSTGRELSK